MTKLINRFLFIIIIISCMSIFTIHSDIFFMSSDAFASEKTVDGKTSDNKTNADIFSDDIFSNNNESETVAAIVASLLNKQSHELDDIDSESKQMIHFLRANVPHLRSKTQEIDSEFRNISLIYQSSKTIPTELNILAKQTNRLLYEIRTIFTPFQRIQNQTIARIEQLNLLADNLKSMDAPPVVPMLKRITALTREYTKISNSLKKILPQTQKLIDSMTAINTSFEKEMPSLWLDYYLGGALNIFSTEALSVFTSSGWKNEASYFNQIWTTASLTLISELPSSLSGWIILLVRTSLACIVFSILLLISLKASILLPPIFHNTWKRILKKSMPWIVLGFSLQYGAWNNHSTYQIIASIGTIFLCLGQIYCAWQLFCMDREAECPKKSPLISILATILVSLFLLTFTPFPLIITLFWFIFVTYLAIHLYKMKKSSFTLLRYLTYGFTGVLIIGMFLVPTGFARFSILITLLYVCFAMGLHQTTVCLHVSSIVHDYLPKNGISALVSNLLLSIIMPIALLIALLSPVSWIFAYPGGEYLIKDFGNFDFNIGTVSLNTMQILSILIVFYLVRSLISISCSYIDNSWNKGPSSVASLTTPIKTTIIFGLWGLFALYVLNVLGFSLTSLAVVAGGLSVGIGLGLQGFVQNIFSGFSLIFGQTIREGDVVNVANITGTVKKVSLRATQVRTYDNAIVFVPNSEFLATTFTNWTHNGRMVRCTLSIGVAYGSNLEIVMETTLNAAKKQDNILKYPEPTIFFMNFGGSSLDFELRFWIREIEDKMSILTQVRLAVDKAFKEQNIEIPFPQTDVHIRSSVMPTLAPTTEDMSNEDIDAESINTEKISTESISSKVPKENEKN